MTPTLQPSPRYQQQYRKIWPWPSLLVEEAAKWVTSLPGEVWLDAACGTGQLGKVVKKRKTLLGLDIEHQEILQMPDSPYQEFIQGSVTSIPLETNSLNGIASLETLEHVPDIDGALLEFSRCLQVKGYLLITVPSVTLRSWWDMTRAHHPIYCDAQEHVREFSSVTINGFPHRFEHWKDLEIRFRKHGFTIRHQDGVGFLFPMWKGKLAWLERGMNLLYGETINRWLGKLPGLRNFPYYLVYVLQLRKEGKRG